MKLFKVKGVISVELQLVTENVMVNRFPCRYLVYLKYCSAIFDDYDCQEVLFTSVLQERDD